MARHRLPPPALTSPRKPHLQLPCYFGIDHLEPSDPFQIWTFETERGILSPLRPGASPIWTADGDQLTFNSRTGPVSLFQAPADGSGEPQPLTAPRDLVARRHFEIPSAWSPDGKTLAFVQFGWPSSDIWLFPLGGEPEPFLATSAHEIQPSFSPDGKWLAFTSDRSGKREVYLVPYPDGEPAVPISPSGGSQPMWARNSGELFYRNGDKMMVVTIGSSKTLQLATPQTLFEGSYANGYVPDATAFYDVTPDGQRFVMVREKRFQDQFQVVVNWFEELKRLAPTDN